MSIASGDEAEDESERQQEMTLSLVQGGESMLVDETDARCPGRARRVGPRTARGAKEVR